MSIEEVWGFIGSSIVIILLLYVTGMAIWKSYKRKNTAWVIALIIYFFLSLNMVTILGFILPVIYLIKDNNAIKRKKDNSKKQHNSLKEFLQTKRHK